ncbi:MAG: WcbI family polysaccharide biosynthesis putative acetyltransferase [Desulfobulbaceae bacterium]|nr:WcbI family polysaccharide biosynthesis putative acetyltransferase [Desulfobulbaceae bacterium]HIJ91447.1 hypothetical protein [Deltaproteobacteria bacterium]
MKELCVIYANCQGGGIQKFLEHHPSFSEKFHCHHISNFGSILEAKPLPYDLLAQASIFIYQPVSTKHGCYGTKNIIAYLPPGCIKISFPYIYNNALWPFFEEGEKIIGREPVDLLFADGISLRKSLNLFLQLQLDFNFSSRFEQTIKILKEKEKETDIKISKFIIDNLQETRLFYTQNHPTNVIFIYCVNQILDLLGSRPLALPKNFPDNFAQLPGLWPISPYDSTAFGYRFSRNDSGWEKFYRKLIIKIHLQQEHPPLTSLMENILFRFF